MANELDYVLRMNAAAFTGPLRGALGSVREVDGATRRMGSSVDGIRTSMSGAGAGAQSLFDKMAQLGGNLANVVSGVKAANEVLGWLKQRGQQAAVANAAVATSATAATAGTSGLATASRAAGAGLGFMGAAAGGAALGVGAIMTAAAAAMPVILAVAGAFAVGAAAFKGVGLAASMEQDLIAFKTLTGSMEQAKTTLAELTQLAESTPFELPDVTAAAKKLLAAKVPTAALADEFRALGNVAAATGADIGGLATVYGQVAGKGKLYAEELQQFVEQGAGALRGALAESLGVTTGMLMDMLSEGKVGFSDLRTAIQGLAGEGGKWGNAMAEQSQTTLGLLSTLKDNVNAIFRAFGTPVNDGPIKAALQSLVKGSGMAAKLVTGAIQQGKIWETLRDVMALGMKMGANKVIEIASELPGKLKPFFKEVGEALKAALKGNFELLAQLGQFDLGKMKFDTSGEEGRIGATIQGTQMGEAAAQAFNDAWANELDNVTPEEPKKPKGSGPADASNMMQSLEIMKQELAILEAQAKGQKALADALQADLDIRKEAAEIVRSTGVSEAGALAMAQRRWAAQKGITAAADAEAEAKRQAEQTKADTKTASSQAQALDGLKAEMAILQAKATGQNELANALQRELNIRQEAKRIAEATGLAEDRALEIARQKAALQEKETDTKPAVKDSRYGEDGRRLSDGRKKIMGFSREKAGLPAFGGQGLLRGFRGAVAPTARNGLQSPRNAPGVVPPGVASRSQQRKEAEEKAAKAFQPRWDLVEAIDKRLASLGLM